MSTPETELQNYLDASTWAEGAATAERRSSFISRRMAALAMSSEVEIADVNDDDFEALAA